MMDHYMGAYIDRRMESLIDEWQLATKRDVNDFVTRLNALAEEIVRLTEVENKASAKLSALEARAKRLKGMAR